MISPVVIVLICIAAGIVLGLIGAGVFNNFTDDNEQD